MSHPDPLHDPENTLPEDDMSPADRWEEIKACASLLKAQVADLQDLLQDYNKSAF